MNNNNYKTEQEVIYLGYIEDTESQEKSIVIKIPLFDKPIVVFCPVLTLLDTTPKLEVGRFVTVYFRTGWHSVMRLDDESLQKKNVSFSEFSNKFESYIESNPPSLNGIEHIPRGCVIVSGKIVGEIDNNLIVNAVVPVLIPNNLQDLQGENLKVGDWVEVKLGQVYFVDDEKSIKIVI